MFRQTVLLKALLFLNTAAIAKFKAVLNDEWMTGLPMTVAQVPFNGLAIPGSHDSGAYNLTREIAHWDKFVQDLYESFGDEHFKDILRAYTITQSMTIYEQLKAGIRYLDMRIAAKENITQDWFFYHKLYGFSAQDMLEETRDFLVQHPKEVVILDFQHFAHFTELHHNQFRYFLLELYSDTMVPRPDVLESLTLELLWSMKKQVIVLYAGYEGNHPLFWPRAQYIDNPWPNHPYVPPMLDYLGSRYGVDRINRTSSFYVTQGVLSPNNFIAEIEKNPNTSLETTLAQKCNLALSGWIQCGQAGLHGINIVMTDFCEFSDIISATIELNFRDFKSD